MNYHSTFIRVAPDSTARTAIVPTARAGKKTIAVLEYEVASENPYTCTQEELQFLVYTQRKGLPEGEVNAHWDELWADFFSRPRACLRSSPLPKKYGWGIHFGADGKLAIYPVESNEYRQYARDERLEQLYALRSQRA